MSRCEDYPCCGHVGDEGPCPPRDASGRQTAMVCVCGARVPLNSRFSLCSACLNRCDEDCNCPRCMGENVDPEEFEDED